MTVRHWSVASLPVDPEDVRRFRRSVDDVAIKRDLWTATERGAEFNRIISALTRNATKLSEGQVALLDMARTDLRAMMDCPRRMRLDDTWPDDFVREARKAADVVISLIELGA